MKIVGLDLSLTGTGIATWCGDRILAETITTKLLGLPRMDYILQQVREFTKAADLVVIEGFSFGSRGAALFEIAGLGYLVRHDFWKREQKFLLVTPGQLKKFVTGKGNADKAIVIREVYKRFGVDVANDDEADAVGLLVIGMALLGQWEPTMDFQRVVVKDLAI